MTQGRGISDEKKTGAFQLHLLGIGVGYSISPSLHNYICKSLELPWIFKTTECPTIEDCLTVLHSLDLAGAIVTMPWKGEIMKFLDHLDKGARMLNACNAVYFRGDGALCGTNTDWVGIQGALRAGLQNAAPGSISVSSKTWQTALIIGAGGAARAAVYALTAGFGVREILILNRDEVEVESLREDCKFMGAATKHLKSLEDVEDFETPAFVIGTVPDFEPVTTEENMVKDILAAFLSRGEKGFMLDMCYHPRLTRHLRLAEEHGWRTVQGSEVVGHQAKALWRLWVDTATVERADWKGMWECLREEMEMKD